MIPADQLDPTRDLHHFATYFRAKPKWIQPYQEFVWHSRSCVQKWLGKSDLKELGKIHMVLIGTSRILHTTSAIQRMMPAAKVNFIQVEVKSSDPKHMEQVLIPRFRNSKICQPNHDNQTMAIMVSHGIWEAYYHHEAKGAFTFDRNAQHTIEFIRKQCAGRNYRLVIMTNPMLQSFDARKDPFTIQRRYWHLSEPIIGPRMQLVSRAWRKAAKKYKLLIVDGEGPSFPRRDVNFDNVHYLLNDPKTFSRVAGLYGNEVSFTFAQLTMAAFLQALQAPFPESLKVTDLGQDPSIDSIRVNITAQDFKLTVQSKRSECITGKCIYRIYMNGPTRHGGYLYNIAKDLYSTSFRIHEPGKYKLLVLLETFQNTSLTTLGEAELDYNKEKGGHCTGERISRPEATISMAFPVPVRGPALSKCEYTSATMVANEFEWVNRTILEKHQYSPENTLMVPSERLDPSGDLHHFEHERNKHPKWIQPYQDYVWHARSCVQPWVRASEIRDLATKLGKLHIVLIGTSRVLDTSTSMQSILMRDAPKGFSALSKLTYLKVTVTTDQPSVMWKRIEAQFDANGICVEKSSDGPAMAILLSHGIWEALYCSSNPFTTFEENARSSIEFIKDRCAGRNYRLVLMTNPMTQNFDSRNDPSVVKRSYGPRKTPIVGTRLQTINSAWLKMAAAYKIPIVDAAGASMARRDVNFDNVHYVLNDRKTHKRIRGRVGNEVSFTFVQLAMAAFLQAFEAPFPDRLRLENTDHGQNPDIESIQLKSIETEANSRDIQLTIRSTRPECISGKCIYRSYLGGPTLHSAYFYPEKETYAATIRVYEPGQYELLVVLEVLVNASLTTVKGAELEFNKTKGGHCDGERISLPHTTFDVNFSSDSKAHRETLPSCRYTIQDFDKNQFEWVNRTILEQENYSPEDTLMIPKERLDPTGELQHFSKFRHENSNWIQPYQNYVWHSRSCVQKWVSPSEIRDLATRLGKLQIAFVGTSRSLDTFTSLKSIMSQAPEGFDAITDIVYGRIEIYRNSFEKRQQVLNKAFVESNICPPELKDDPNAPAMAIMLSHGIWESNYHDWTPGVFNFDVNAQESIEFIKKRCAGRKYRLILMTNPMTHSFNSNIDASTVTRRYFYLPEPIMGTRLQTVNTAWRKMAAKYDLPIIDAAAASMARRDVNFDNVHYVLTDRKTHRRIPGRVGNEVSFTFAQLAMAAFLQAFEVPFPQSLVDIA